MKVLFIGGTGLISTACTRLAVERGIDMYLLNRGRSRTDQVPDEATVLTADARDRDGVASAIEGHQFDVVVDWIAFTPDHVEQDIELFAGMVRQYIFISSASAYQKPPSDYLVTESTPLANPHWEYSRQKAACEERLLAEYRESGFPYTVVRPSLTYGPSMIPLCVGAWNKPWTIVDRMRRGEKIIVPGDGTSLWQTTWNGDFAVGLVGLLGNQRAVGHAFHITTDEVLTWNQLYQEVARAAGADPEFVHVPTDLICAYQPHEEGNLWGDKSWSIVLDNSKIKRFVPDFVCTTTFAQGIRRSIAWFEADPDRQEIDHEANEAWDRIIAAYEGAFPSD
ncbi:MAG: SDR family oxidoreductase [Candidatus Brocadiia bacterium]